MALASFRRFTSKSSAWISCISWLSVALYNIIGHAWAINRYYYYLRTKRWSTSDAEVIICPCSMASQVLYPWRRLAYCEPSAELVTACLSSRFAAIGVSVIAIVVEESRPLLAILLLEGQPLNHRLPPPQQLAQPLFLLQPSPVATLHLLQAR